MPQKVFGLFKELAMLPPESTFLLITHPVWAWVKITADAEPTEPTSFLVEGPEQY